MTIIFAAALGLVMGVVFGFALEKSRVIDPETIIGQFQLKNFIMLKVFLTAIATGLLVFSLFFYLGFDRLSWKTTAIGSDVIGGLLLGIGVALAGACPGTVFAQIGAGYRDSLMTLAGAIIGAIVYAQTKPFFQTILSLQWPSQKLTIDHFLGCPFWVAALALFCIIVGVLILLEKYRPWKKEVISLSTKDKDL